MADEPVSAWREPWGRRARRWARRNRTAVAAAVVALVAGWGWGRGGRQPARTSSEAGEAENRTGAGGGPRAKK